MAWRFSRVVRGYDPSEVDRYVEDLERHNSELLKEIESKGEVGEKAPAEAQPTPPGAQIPEPISDLVDQLKFQLGQLAKLLEDMDHKSLQQSKSVEELSGISLALKEEQRSLLTNVESSQERIVSALAQLSDQLLSETNTLSQRVEGTIGDNFSRLSDPISELVSKVSNISEDIAEKVSSKTVTEVTDVQREMTIGLAATEEKLKATQDHLLGIADQLNERQLQLAEKLCTTTEETAIKLNTNQKQLILTMAQATEGLERMEGQVTESLDRIDKLESIYEKTNALLTSASEQVGVRNEELESSIVSATKESLGQFKDEIASEINGSIGRLVGEGDGSIVELNKEIIESIGKEGRYNREMVETLSKRVEALKAETTDGLLREREQLLGAIAEIGSKINEMDLERVREALEGARNSMLESVSESSTKIAGVLGEKQEEVMARLDLAREGLEKVKEDVGVTFERVLEKLGELSVDEISNRLSAGFSEAQRDSKETLEAIRSEISGVRKEISEAGRLLSEEVSNRDQVAEDIQSISNSLKVVEGTVEGGLVGLSSLITEIKNESAESDEKMFSKVGGLSKRIAQGEDRSSEDSLKVREELQAIRADFSTEIEKISGKIDSGLDDFVRKSSEILENVERSSEKTFASAREEAERVAEAVRDQSETLIGGLKEGFDNAEMKISSVQESMAASLVQISEQISERERSIVKDLEEKSKARFEESRVMMSDTLSSLETRLKDIVEGMAGNLPSRVVADLSGSYGELVGQIGVTFKQNFDKMKNEFSGIMERSNQKNAESIEEVLSRKIEEMPAALSSFGESLTVDVGEKMTGVGDVLSREVQEIKKSTEKEIESIKTDGIAVIADEMKRIEGELSSRIEGVSEKSIVSLLELTEKLSAAQAEALDNVSADITANLDASKEDIGSAISTLSATLNEKDKKLGKNLGDGLTEKINGLKEVLAGSFVEMLENTKASFSELAARMAASSELTAAEIKSLEEKLGESLSDLVEKGEHSAKDLIEAVDSKIVDEHLALRTGLTDVFRESMQSIEGKMVESSEAMADLSESEAQRYSEQAAKITEIGERVDSLAVRVPKKEELESSIGDRVSRDLSFQSASFSELLQRKGEATVEAMTEMGKTVETQLGEMRNEFSGVAFRNAQDIGESLEDAIRRMEEIPSKTSNQIRSEIDEISSSLSEKLETVSAGFNSRFSESVENIVVAQTQLAAKVTENLEAISSEVDSLVGKFEDQKAAVAEKLDGQKEALSKDYEQITTKVDFSRERILTAMRQVTEDVEDIKKNLVERIVSETTHTLKDSYAEVMESITGVTEEKLSATQEKILTVLAEATEQLNDIPANMAGQIADRTAEKLNEFQSEITKTLSESSEKMNQMANEISDRLAKQIEKLDKVEGELLEKITDLTSREIEGLKVDFLDRLDTASEGLQAPVNAVLHLLMSRS